MGYKHMLNLSDGQKKKQKVAFRKRKPTIIGLAGDKIKVENMEYY